MKHAPKDVYETQDGYRCGVCQAEVSREWPHPWRHRPVTHTITIRLNKEPAMTYSDPRTLLVDENRIPLCVGDHVVTFRGEKMRLVGWDIPHKPESTGRVYIQRLERDPSELTTWLAYFPGVINAEFVVPVTEYEKRAARPEGSPE